MVGLSQRRSEFNVRSVYVEFVVHGLKMVKVLSSSTSDFPTMIILLIFYTKLFSMTDAA